MARGRAAPPAPYRPRGSRRLDRRPCPSLRPDGRRLMRGMIEGIGITWPTYGDWVAAAVAAGLVVAIWLLAHAIGRFLGPRIAHFWASRAGGRGEELVAHLCSLVRYAVAAILIAIILNLDAWRP